MDRRSVAATVAGAIGAIGISNRLISRQVDPLSPPLQRETGTYRWRGMDIAYTEGGDPEDPDLVVWHDPSIAGSSREFRRLFEQLADSYHVLAPDLPGFGRSDRPPVSYSHAFYEAFVRDFIEDTTSDPICIASSLSAAYVVAAAESVSLSKLLLICPNTSTRGRSSRVLGSLLRVPIVGSTTFNLLRSKPGLRYQRRQQYVDSAVESPTDREYAWQTSHQPGARFAPAGLIAGTADSPIDLGRTLAALDIPTTLIWGRESTDPDLVDARSLAETADTKLIVIDRARTRPHVEQAPAVLDLLDEELAEPVEP